MLFSLLFRKFVPITILDIMNLKEPFVITISREIGSGGHTVGQMLAEKLDTRFSLHERH